jgi:hypothetical protein
MLRGGSEGEEVLWFGLGDIEISINPMELPWTRHKGKA